MKVKPNERFFALNESYLFAETERRILSYISANPCERVIRLGVGDVTLPLPKAAVCAMKTAAEEMGDVGSFRGYPPYFGYGFLREAISRHYKRRGVSISFDEVFVSDGAKSDSFGIIDLFGDAPFLICDPAYPVYAEAATLAGKRVKYIGASKENGFVPSPRGLTEEGAVVYLCSPNNPTGAAYGASALSEWVNWAARSGSLIIFDAAYESYISTDAPHSIFELDGARECAVEIGSLSKSAGFTGVRCSWTAIPKDIMLGGARVSDMWGRIRSARSNGVSYITQRGAEAALSDAGYAEYMKNVAHYGENAKIISSALEKAGVFHTGGENSPYVWMECPRGLSSWEFFDYLLFSARVAGTPGAGFGKNGEGFFRLTGYASRADTEEAAARLLHALS